MENTQDLEVMEKSGNLYHGYENDILPHFVLILPPCLQKMNNVHQKFGNNDRM